MYLRILKLQDVVGFKCALWPAKSMRGQCCSLSWEPLFIIFILLLHFSFFRLKTSHGDFKWRERRERLRMTWLLSVYEHSLVALSKYGSLLPVVHFAEDICITAGVPHTTPARRFGQLSRYTNRPGWLLFFSFASIYQHAFEINRSTASSFWVLHFPAWCAVSLRISVQTASLWQRARWVASDTTSQTTHQTNTLKALSTLTLYHLICVIRAPNDNSTIWELAISH